MILPTFETFINKQMEEELREEVLDAVLLALEDFLDRKLSMNNILSYSDQIVNKFGTDFLLDAMSRNNLQTVINDFLTIKEHSGVLA